MRGAQFVPIGIPTIGRNTLLPKWTKILSRKKWWHKSCPHKSNYSIISIIITDKMIYCRYSICNHFNICNTFNEHSGVNHFLSVEKLAEVLGRLRKFDSIDSYDFPTLYTTLSPITVLSLLSSLTKWYIVVTAYVITAWFTEWPFN
jgi:hypothetical protein